MSRRRSTRHPTVKVSDLDFADDIALTLDTTQEAQNLLSGCECGFTSKCQKDRSDRLQTANGRNQLYEW